MIYLKSTENSGQFPKGERKFNQLTLWLESGIYFSDMCLQPAFLNSPLIERVLYQFDAGICQDFGEFHRFIFPVQSTKHWCTDSLGQILAILNYYFKVITYPCFHMNQVSPARHPPDMSGALIENISLLLPHLVSISHCIHSS